MGRFRRCRGWELAHPHWCGTTPGGCGGYGHQRAESIDGHRYVDGGACSATSVDLLSGLGLDEVYVVAPLVSLEMDHPRSLLVRMERRWRASVTRRCLHEIGKLETDGATVTLLAPGPEDLEAIGGNVMQASRRITVLETSLRTSARALANVDATLRSTGTG